MSKYLVRGRDTHRMHLPLKGSLDITYKCNNRCKHCWLVGSDKHTNRQELTFDEIINLVNEARSLGCREWGISGGEPMLRPDFYEIFDYITSNSFGYSLNTNGTLITPRIAQLMKRRGAKMVCLYGATADVHDHITGNPGSFEAALQGIDYLREAGASFTTQLMVMKDNHHQLDDMLALAKSMSSSYRFGGDWLNLSATGDPARNAEICRQRLDPSVIVKDLIQPSPWVMAQFGDYAGQDKSHMFDACILKEEFHVDPYGDISFCFFIKDPALRLSLRDFGFTDIWENRLSQALDAKQKDICRQEEVECLTCELRTNCYWCPAHSYIEHRNYTSKIDYLCAIARENRRFQEDVQMNNCRYFSIGGVDVKIQSDLPFSESTFHSKLADFAVDSPGEDVVTLTYKPFDTPPSLDERSLGSVIHALTPWTIYANDQFVTYVCLKPGEPLSEASQFFVFDRDHTNGRCFFPRQWFEKGNAASLAFMPTDQIFVSILMSRRQAAILHSAGVILDGQGLMFVGHSEAGKSTTVKMLMDQAEILCDDRNIARYYPGEGFRLYGTWSHGEIPTISSSSAPLRAICFLNKADENRLELVTSKQEIILKLIPRIIKGLELPEWWDKELKVIEQIANEVPCYNMYFDKSGAIVDVLKSTLCEPAGLVGSRT